MLFGNVLRWQTDYLGRQLPGAAGPPRLPPQGQAAGAPGRARDGGVLRAPGHRLHRRGVPDGRRQPAPRLQGGAQRGRGAARRARSTTSTSASSPGAADRFAARGRRRAGRPRGRAPRAARRPPARCARSAASSSEPRSAEPTAQPVELLPTSADGAAREPPFRGRRAGAARSTARSAATSSPSPRAASSTPTPASSPHDDIIGQPEGVVVRSTRGARLHGAPADARRLRAEDAARRAGDLPEGPRADPDAGRHLPGRAGARVGRRVGRAVDDDAARRRRRHRLRAARGLRRPGPRQRRVVPRRRSARRATTSRCATATRASTRRDLDRIVLDLPEPWQVVQARREGAAPRRHPRRLHADASSRPSSCARRSTKRLRAGRDARGAAARWHIEGQSVRPDHRMVAHTGFLTHARLLGLTGRVDHREPPRRRARRAAVAAAVGGYRLGLRHACRVVGGPARRRSSSAPRLLPGILRTRPTERRADRQLLLVAVAVLVGCGAARPGHRAAARRPAASVRVRDRAGPPGRPGRSAASRACCGVARRACGCSLPGDGATCPGWPARLRARLAVARASSTSACPTRPTRSQRAAAPRRRQLPRRCSTRCARHRTSVRPRRRAASTDDRGATRRRSTVKVEGRRATGSRRGPASWSGPDLVATNAHVVAGEARPARASRRLGTRPGHGGGLRPRARPGQCSAVPDLDRPAAAVGTAIGRPGRGVRPSRRADRSPGAVPGGPTRSAPRAPTSTTAHRRAATSSSSPRAATGRLRLRAGRPARATVVGVAFAIAPDRPAVAYALDPSRAAQPCCAPCRPARRPRPVHRLTPTRTRPEARVALRLRLASRGSTRPR